MKVKVCLHMSAIILLLFYIPLFCQPAFITLYILNKLCSYNQTVAACKSNGVFQFFLLQKHVDTIRKTVIVTEIWASVLEKDTVNETCVWRNIEFFHCQYIGQHLFCIIAVGHGVLRSRTVIPKGTVPPSINCKEAGLLVRSTFEVVVEIVYINVQYW